MEKIKAIFTDLDNTLWKGTIAEKEKIELNQKYYSLLQSAYDKGISIFALSKNDKTDVIDAMNGLKLDKELFTEIIANWDPKYLNLEKILTQTNIRPETTIFIDDNSLELAQIRKKLPSVNCINAENWEDIKKIKYFSQKRNDTEVDIADRKTRYRLKLSTNRLKETFTGKEEDFLRLLKLELTIGKISFENSYHVDRFANLLFTTHQINLNPYKFKNTSNTIDYLFDKSNNNYSLYGVSIKNQNKSIGLNGGFVVQKIGTRAVVEDGTFSCGIIGYDFEQKSILSLIDILRKEHITKIEFPVTLTSSNIRVRKMFENLGIELKTKEGEKATYIVDVEHYTPENNYDWIKVNYGTPDMENAGIQSIMEFFDKNIKPTFKKNSVIINLGAAKGEVLGHFRRETRTEFYEHIKQSNITYKKIDLENLPEEETIVGNAENLEGVIKNNSADVVMALELLEHTEHFWNVINESIRVCKTGGYIALTMPSYNYPKHEYPIDLWRIGPETIRSFFPKEYFTIKSLELEGNSQIPRRTMILIQKNRDYSTKYSMPENGRTNWETGLTIFP